jgi:hypothetical protein
MAPKKAGSGGLLDIEKQVRFASSKGEGRGVTHMGISMDRQAAN